MNKFPRPVVCCLQAGEELTISYIDLGLPRSERRHLLSKFFYFQCTCGRWVLNGRASGLATPTSECG